MLSSYDIWKTTEPDFSDPRDAGCSACREDECRCDEIAADHASLDAVVDGEAERTASGHTTQIETVSHGNHDGRAIGELHLYHRWTCSCGAAGAWGHSLWARNSIKSAEASAQRHVLNARKEG
jgi:hypothetical protein